MLRLFFILLPLAIFAHPMTDLQKHYAQKPDDYTPRTRHLDDNGKAKFVNHLILSNSPYLLQHAHNPVDWYEFSDEAFARAKAENKVIFLSIGYATCHWCHVMEEESFDDLEVAAAINENFIAIKVDREIRPDVDAAFMSVSQLLNGSGGWPLNAFLTPEGKAFFAGTYFPKKTFIGLLNQTRKIWDESADKVLAQAGRIENILNKTAEAPIDTLDKTIVKTAVRGILSTFDELQGGFGAAPKFPHESLLLFLLDFQLREPSDEVLEAITETLDAMAAGGLYDAVGGGFHRYATDPDWLIPHFEKMLYNQAQLALVYAEGYRLTKKPLYRYIARRTLDYAQTELWHKDGGFMSATDADSEGEEGTFFLWTVAGLQDALAAEEFATLENYLDLSQNVDFEGGKIIRFKNVKMLGNDDFATLEPIFEKLDKVRKNRPPPLTDYKILLSWNALMAKSLIEAGKRLDDENDVQAGIRLAEFLETTFRQNGGYHRVLIDGKTSTPALFEDYAYLADAYLSAYDQTLDAVWLGRVRKIIEGADKKFFDPRTQNYKIGEDSEFLAVKTREGFDGAIPAANGIFHQVLVKFFNRAPAPADEHKKSAALIQSFAREIEQSPSGYNSFIQGLMMAEEGEISSPRYLFSGRAKIIQATNGDWTEIKIVMHPDWHINSNTPLDKSLIATRVENLNKDGWTLETVDYPDGVLENLGFSKMPVSVYKNEATIRARLQQKSTTHTPRILSLSLQACSDKTCLPPATVRLVD